MSTTRRSRTPSLSSSRAVASSNRRRVSAPRLPSGRPSSATAASAGVAGEEDTAADQTRRGFVDCGMVGQVADELVARVDDPSRWLHANDLEVRLRAGEAEDRAVLPVAATKLVDDAEADEIPVERDRRVEVGT